MKKVLLGIGVVLLIAGTVAFASTQSKTSAQCENEENCEYCPCTPDCQPGDEWCECPAE